MVEWEGDYPTHQSVRYLIGANLSQGHEQPVTFERRCEDEPRRRGLLKTAIFFGVLYVLAETTDLFGAQPDSTKDNSLVGIVENNYL